MTSQSPSADCALHDTAALEAVRQLQQMLGATVRTSRALVRCGRPIDLAGMDRHVGMLCAKTLDLQPETGRVMRAELVALLSDIEALCAALVGADT